MTVTMTAAMTTVMTAPGPAGRAAAMVPCRDRDLRACRVFPAAAVTMAAATHTHRAAFHDQGQALGQGPGHTPPRFGQQAAEGGWRDLHPPGGLLMGQAFRVGQTQGFQHVQAQRHGRGISGRFREEAPAAGFGRDEAYFLRSHGLSFI